MKLRIGLLLLLSVSIALGSDFRRDIPHATWEPIFFGEINQLSRKVHWKPLRAAPVGADSLEVRVWIGFGVVPLEAFRLHWDGIHWSAEHVFDTVQTAAPASVHAVSPKSGWTAMWRELTRLGLLSLPDSSVLPGE